jgi:hypothetical protein
MGHAGWPIDVIDIGRMRRGNSRFSLIEELFASAAPHHADANISWK